MTVTTGAFDGSGIPQGTLNRLDDLRDVDVSEVVDGQTIVRRNGRWVPNLSNEVSVGGTEPTDGTELWLDLADASGIAVLKYRNPETGVYAPIPTAAPPPIDPSTIDHGALADKSADDHPQYLLENGTRTAKALTVESGGTYSRVFFPAVDAGIWVAQSYYPNALVVLDNTGNTFRPIAAATPSIPQHLATKAYVDTYEAASAPTAAANFSWYGTGHPMRVTRHSGMVTLEIALKRTAAGAIVSDQLIATVPTGFRPVDRGMGAALVLSGGSYKTGVLLALSDGNVYLSQSTVTSMAINDYIGGSVTYQKGSS